MSERRWYSDHWLTQAQIEKHRERQRIYKRRQAREAVDLDGLLGELAAWLGVSIENTRRAVLRAMWEAVR